MPLVQFLFTPYDWKPAKLANCYGQPEPSGNQMLLGSGWILLALHGCVHLLRGGVLHQPASWLRSYNSHHVALMASLQVPNVLQEQGDEG